MTNSKHTKKALLASVVALLMCCSMLIGTTFAWFTDSVSSVNNIITAGNLDVELTNKDGSLTKPENVLFDEILWEPGVVAYENLTVSNVGTLALQYNLDVTFVNQNVVVDNGLGLADVLKVAIVPGPVKDNDRDTLTSRIKNWTLLSDLDEVGKLYPEGSTEGPSVEEFAIVIWWEPKDAEYDNQWNVNNGRVVSDYDKNDPESKNELHITLAVNLFATQLSYEEDSFNEFYDGLVLAPDADVDPIKPYEISATIGMNNLSSARKMLLDTMFRFETTESYEEAKKNAHRYWHADFVVSADKDVKAESIALAGYYDAYCADYNDNNWVALISPDDIAAGQEIRLLYTMLNGGSMNYQELCNWVPVFLCGAVDLTGENAGTTLTVELRLYETTGDPSTDSGSKNDETGEYITVGIYKHTFANKVSTAAELKDYLAAGQNVTLTADIELDADETISIPSGKESIIDLNGYTLSSVSDATGSNRNMIDVNGGTLTVRNGTITTKHTGDNMGWGNSTNVFNVTAGGVLNIENAIVENLGGSDMAFGVHLNNWGEVTLNVTDSTIKSTYCAVRVFNSGYDKNNVTIQDSTIYTKGNRAFWVHNYTGDDSLLNFDIFGNGNTYVAETDALGAPIRYGFDNAIFFTADGVKVVKAADQAALDNVLSSAAGKVTVSLPEGNYQMPSSGSNGEITITGTQDTVIDMTMGAYLENATVTIEGVTIKTSTGKVNGNGSDYAALYTPDVTYVNCTFVGPMRVGRDGAKFIGCTFTGLGNDYVWTYGNDVTFEGCTFNTDGKAILIYNDGGNEVAKVTVKDCIFNSTQGAKAGAIANQNCAAIEIDNYGHGVELTTSGNTYDSNFSGEWRIKSYDSAKTKVIVNGTEYTTIALDGKTMTIDANKNVTVQ